MTGEDSEDKVRMWVYPEDRNRINAMRKGGEGQADVLNRVLDNYDPNRADAPPEEFGLVRPESALEENTEDSIPDDVREQLDRIESAASTAEERAGTIQRELEDLQR